jgi:hypothetical protein
MFFLTTTLNHLVVAISDGPIFLPQAQTALYLTFLIKGHSPNMSQAFLPKQSLDCAGVLKTPS